MASGVYRPVRDRLGAAILHFCGLTRKPAQDKCLTPFSERYSDVLGSIPPAHKQLQSGKEIQLGLSTASRPQKIGVAIVNYFKGADVVDAVRLLQRQDNSDRISYAIVDNSCDEAEFERLRSLAGPETSIFQNSTNTGYSRGVNLAAAALGEVSYLLLVSPDVKPLSPDVVAALCAGLDDHPEIGILASTQIDPAGQPVEVARRYPSLARQVMRRAAPDRFNEIDLSVLQTGEGPGVQCVDWVQSSFVMIRGSVWRALGGFDIRFRIFMADIDISKRASMIGLRTAIMSGYDVRSDGLRASAGGIAEVLTNRVGRTHIADAIRYYARWH